MSAERGWIGQPQLVKEWHTPGWVKTGGRHFGRGVDPPRAPSERGQQGHEPYAAPTQKNPEQEEHNAALHQIDHSHIPLLRIAARNAAGWPRAWRLGDFERN